MNHDFVDFNTAKPSHRIHLSSSYLQSDHLPMEQTFRDPISLHNSFSVSLILTYQTILCIIYSRLSSTFWNLWDTHIRLIALIEMTHSVNLWQNILLWTGVRITLFLIRFR